MREWKRCNTKESIINFPKSIKGCIILDFFSLPISLPGVNISREETITIMTIGSVSRCMRTPRGKVALNVTMPNPGNSDPEAVPLSCRLGQPINLWQANSGGSFTWQVYMWSTWSFHKLDKYHQLCQVQKQETGSRKKSRQHVLLLCRLLFLYMLITSICLWSGEASGDLTLTHTKVFAHA